MKNNKYLQLLFLIMGIVLIGLTGCSAANESRSAAEDMSVAQSGPFETEAAEEALLYADGESVPVEEFISVALAQAQNVRVIIYTGDVSLVVKDTQEAIDQITALAEEAGGFVSGSNVYESGDVLRGSITIRVPADRYQGSLTQLRELAIRVERESSNTQDVTEEFTDLQARKTNLEFTEDALQTLLEERQRVGSTSDILEVYRELTTIRGQIEQIEGRLRYLANQSALSTITIELTPDILYQPVTVAGWQPQGVAREALQALVVALQGVINFLIWAVVFILPLLVVISIPVVIVVVFIRRWLKRRQQGPPKAAAKSS